jgi:MerR family transcriptional regulator, light-induced transcriptional regulator
MTDAAADRGNGAPPGHLRIGELARRAGVSPETLRAWERRYGLLSPARSPGGYRLYSEEDERRLRVMRDHVDGGVAPAEAARLTLAGAAPEPAPQAPPRPLDDAREALMGRVLGFDEAGAQAVIDRALADYSVEAVLDGLLLPCLREVGERWEAGTATVAQEHFASGVVRGRLLGLARGWDQGRGPRALLSCAPGEQHDIGLICFGLALRALGWRITYLGQDTPIGTLGDAVRRLRPDRVVISASDPALVADAAAELSALADRTTLWLGGPGVTPEIAARIEGSVLTGSPLEAARALAARG